MSTEESDIEVPVGYTDYMRKFFGTRYLSKFTHWTEFLRYEEPDFDGHDFQVLWNSIKNTLPDFEDVSEDFVPFWNILTDASKEELWSEWIQQVQRIMRAGKLPPFHKHAGQYDGKEIDMNITLDGRLLTSKGTLLRNKLGLQRRPPLPFFVPMDQSRPYKYHIPRTLGRDGKTGTKTKVLLVG